MYCTREKKRLNIQQARGTERRSLTEGLHQGIQQTFFFKDRLHPITTFTYGWCFRSSFNLPSANYYKYMEMSRLFYFFQFPPFLCVCGMYCAIAKEQHKRGWWGNSITTFQARANVERFLDVINGILMGKGGGGLFRLRGGELENEGLSERRKGVGHLLSQLLSTRLIDFEWMCIESRHRGQDFQLPKGVASIVRSSLSSCCSFVFFFSDGLIGRNRHLRPYHSPFSLYIELRKCIE